MDESAMTAYFWVSWYAQSGDGPFTLATPWWISGARLDGAKSICAAVPAASAEEAREKILLAHDIPPPALEWRFCTPNEGSPFSDRFQRAEWMEWPGE